MNQTEADPLLVRQEATTAVLTLNRPEALNALNAALLERLRDALHAAVADESVRAIVITGAGERAFCAGADIKHMQHLDAEGARRWARLGHDLFQELEDLPKPVLAAVNGLALGGGCELASACDFRFLAESARIGQPEVKLGLMPGWGGTQRLPRLIGMTAAKELVLTGRTMPADEALRVGFANAVVPAHRLLAHVLEFAAQFATLPPLAIGFAKRAMHVGRDLPLREANAVEIDLFGQCFETADKEEGMAAFVEKRAPRFQGR